MSQEKGGTGGCVATILVALITAGGAILAAKIGGGGPNINIGFPPCVSPSAGSSPLPTPCIPQPVTPCPPLPPPPPEPTPNQSEIKTVIRTSYMTFRNALKNFDKERLRKSYTDNALKSTEEEIEANNNLPSGKRLSTIIINYNYNQETKFEDYQVINNKEVKIRASRRIRNVEFWDTSNQCISHQPEHTVTFDFTLKKTSEGWLISNLESLSPIVSVQ